MSRPDKVMVTLLVECTPEGNLGAAPDMVATALKRLVKSKVMLWAGDSNRPVGYRIGNVITMKYTEVERQSADASQ